MALATMPDGAKLHYLDTGEGTPVLCIPGLTRNHRDFNFVAPHLNARLIRVDLRGRGDSDWTGPDSYTVQQEAADMIALMDHLGLDRVAVLGTSRGGLIAMALAATGRLSGVALNDIGPVIDQGGLAAIKDYVGKPPPWTSYEQAAKARPTVMKGFANVSPDRWLDEVRGIYGQGPDGLTLRYDPRLAETLTGGDVPDLWPFFDALPQPLAVIRGANSNLLSADTVAKMAHRRPDLIRADVPDRGHVPFLDEPPALEALHTWLARL